MSNEEPIAEKVDESLASQMGDPTGQPQAVEAKDPVLRLIGGVGVTIVVVGGLLLPAIVSTQNCRGIPARPR